MWFLLPDTKYKMEKAELDGFQPSAEQVSNFESRIYDDHSDIGKPRILSINENKAFIDITGVLTKKPCWMSMFFGGGNTTYRDIITSLNIAEGDKSITDITLRFDSPGGHATGIYEVVDTINASSKKITALIEGTCASAAYGIASQCSKITASNRSDIIGSIGVLQQYYVDDNKVSVTSTKAPKKSPDVRTDEGKKVVQESLDALHDLFVSTIAEGRGKSVDIVNETFGQGGIFLADSARQRGMIDDVQAIQTKPLGNKKNANSKSIKSNMESKIMDINTLKAQHPETYQAVFALGEAKERDRVSAHVIMGNGSGAMDVACKAITEGTEMTATLQATYMSAQMNKKDVDNRLADDKDTAKAADGIVGDNNIDAGSEVASLLENEYGMGGA